MAVDVVLVLHSEHRRLLQLAERAGRPGRGFHDPAGDLQRALYAHLIAATAEIYPTAARLCPGDAWPGEALAAARVVAEDPRTGTDELSAAARGLVRTETEVVLPALEQRLEVGARRRMGKVFRLRRDAAARNAATTRRRHRSQTELYEMARRAGIEQRSRMTQAELQAAIEARGLNA